MKINWKIVVAIVLICGIALFVQNYLHDKEMVQLKQHIEESDVLRMEAETAYSKLQLTVSERLAEKEIENAELRAIINSRDESIEQYKKIVFQQDSIIFALQEGTIEEDSTGETVVHFMGYQEPYTVDGRTWCISGNWTLRIDRDPFTLECVVVRTRLGDIKRLYVSTNDTTLKIQEVQFNVVPEYKSFFKNLSFDLGAMYSKAHGPGIMLGLGYDRYNAGITGHEESLGIYFMKSF